MFDNVYYVLYTVGDVACSGKMEEWITVKRSWSSSFCPALLTYFNHIVGHMSAKSATSAKSTKFFILRKTANLFLSHLADLATSANSLSVLSKSVFQKF